jgi:hypothetical protein
VDGRIVFSATPATTGPTISGLSDGDEITIAVNGGGTSQFSRFRARQCKPNQPVNNVTEFNPQVANHCSAATLGAGSPGAFVDSGPLPPGTGSVQITFRVGIGVAPDVISAVDDELIPGFTCDESTVCLLVVNAEVTTGSGSSNLLSFPLRFGAAATAPGQAHRGLGGRRERPGDRVLGGARVRRRVTHHVLRGHLLAGGPDLHLGERPVVVCGVGVDERDRLHVHGHRIERDRCRPALGPVFPSDPEGSGQSVHRAATHPDPGFPLQQPGRAVLDPLGGGNDP